VLLLGVDCGAQNSRWPRAPKEEAEKEEKGERVNPRSPSSFFSLGLTRKRRTIYRERRE